MLIDTIGWKIVSSSYFIAHQHDLGMEIVSYHNETMDAFAKPIGYAWTIGDSIYGSWQLEKDSFGNIIETWKPTENSKRYKEWYKDQKNTKAMYFDYETNYKGIKAFYGGENGEFQYGTRSEQERIHRFYYYRRIINSSSWKTHKDQIQRKDSRYSNSSSTRSRSGGYGK